MVMLVLTIFGSQLLIICFFLAAKAEEGEGPDFITPLERTVANEGATVHLKCDFTGTPTPDIKWFKDDRPLALSRRTSPKVRGKSAILTIHDVETDDSGSYKCLATNKFGEADCSAPLRVEKDTSPPTFIQKFADTRVTEGESTTLLVKVEGNPEPSIEWFVNGNKIFDYDDKYRIRMKEFGVSTLAIEEMTQSEVGTYRCIATNAVGEERCEANVSVGTRIGAPEISRWSTEFIDCVEGDNIDIEATVLGNVSFLEWYKDNDKLYADSHYSFRESGNVHALFIKNIQRAAHAGVYRVFASNPLGNVSRKVTVRVRG